MEKQEALNEVLKMWTWLYKHPAHDKEYYGTYVSRQTKPWKNNCPVCEIADDTCSNCLLTVDDPKETFCTAPDSPYRKWLETPVDNPDYRTLYAGDIIALARKVNRGGTAAAQ